MELYWHKQSGHSHRAVAFLSILGVPCTKIEVDLRGDEQRTAAFLRLNPFGQVPVLVDDDGTMVADSNAILVYLARKYGRSDWYPDTPAASAEVQTWLSRAAGELARGPCAARLITVWNEHHLEAEEVIGRAHGFLRLVDAHLSTRPWLAAGQPTIADLAHYAYIAHAPEGNVDLSGYRHIIAWLASVEQIPGFVPLHRTAAGLQDAAPTIPR
jgi:glutathione S-transferase